MVALLTLDQSVWVQILVRQPTENPETLCFRGFLPHRIKYTIHLAVAIHVTDSLVARPNPH